MRVIPTERRLLLDSLVTEFLQHYRKGRTILAVDGVDSAATRQLAVDLAERFEVAGHGAFAAALDDLRLPVEERGVSRDGERTADEDDLLRRVLLEPFRMGLGAGFVLRAYDPARDELRELEWEMGPKDATLVLAGEVLRRESLRGIAHQSVWLDDGAALSTARDAAARAAASILVDARDPARPVRVFADSC